MAITWTGAGGLYTRLGYLIKSLVAENTNRGSTQPGFINALIADLSTNDQVDASTMTSALTGLQGASNGFLATCQQVAQNIVISAANNDSPLPSLQFTLAWPYVYNQMITASQTVQRNSISISSSAGGSNVGNNQIVVTDLNSNGLPSEYDYQETIAGTVIGDSQSGTATAFQEPIQFLGQAAAPNFTSYLYPAGSGSVNTINAVNALANNQGGAGNFLYNGSFESWLATPNVPDGFHVIVGVPGTSILKSTGQFYDGVASLQFVGDSSTLDSLYTAFGADTTNRLGISFAYAFNCWIRTDVVPAAGVFAVSLTDGSNAVINDNQGSPNTATKAVTGLTANTWTPFSGVFRTNRIVPVSGVRLRIGLSVALTTGSNLYVDRFALAPMNSLYLGGPGVAVFSGNTASVRGDTYNVISVNSRNGVLTSGCDQLLPLKQNGFLIPSVASSPTIPDSLG